ncbi:MAG: DUF3696 domain-containing protein [Chitinophagaceae bacterium]
MEQTFVIKDFKIFEEQSITLKNLTVLAGSNSVGKSTIIQAILLSRWTFEERYRSGSDVKTIPIPLNGPFLLELGNTYEVIRRGKKITQSVCEFKLIQSGKTLMKIKLEGDRTTNNRYELWTKFDVFKGNNKGLLGQKVYYLAAERIGPRLKYEYEILPYLHAGYRGERTFQILSGENLPVSGLKLLNEEDPPLLFDQTRKWLDYLIPGAKFDNAIPVGKSKVIEGTFGESLPTNVGFGISYALPILVNGLLAEADTIMIVENPEAHLHPASQSRMGKFLAKIASSGVQVIIETHSEHVLNGIRIEAINGGIASSDIIVNFITRDKERRIKLEKIEILETGDLTKFPRDFFDQVQQDMAEMYRTKKRQNNG